jgi:putative OPT family oligopeptide transporter
MLAGGLLGWFVFIPAIATFGADTVLYPGTDTIGNLYAENGAGQLWSYYIRYIGAGMVAAGGIISLVKSMPLIVSTFKSSIKGMKDSGGTSTLRTEKDLNMKVVLFGVLAIILLIWLLPQIPVSLIGAILIALFGFFFGAVSSIMVGLVGSSNNPVSGMAIATLLFSTFILKITGETGASGMVGAIAIGSIICIVTAMAGDTSQDLKTGFLLGATPKKQQIGEIIGAVVSAFAIGGVLILLDKAWGFGTTELAAPQASLMKMIVEGVMNGNLPWALVFIGVFTAIVVEILGVPVLPVAIGLYLPLELSTTIMIGGAIRWVVDKKSKAKNDEAGSGVLFCSGMIAGEGLVGIILAILAVAGLEEKINLSGYINLGTIGGIILLVVMIACVAIYAMKNKAEADKAAEEKNEEE